MVKKVHTSGIPDRRDYLHGKKLGYGKDKKGNLFSVKEFGDEVLITKMVNGKYKPLWYKRTSR